MLNALMSLDAKHGAEYVAMESVRIQGQLALIDSFEDIPGFCQKILESEAKYQASVHQTNHPDNNVFALTPRRGLV